MALFAHRAKNNDHTKVLNTAPDMPLVVTKELITLLILFDIDTVC